MAVKRIDHIAIVVPNIEEAESFTGTRWGWTWRSSRRWKGRR